MTGQPNYNSNGVNLPNSKPLSAGTFGPTCCEVNQSIIHVLKWVLYCRSFYNICISIYICVVYVYVYIYTDVQTHLFVTLNLSCNITILMSGPIFWRCCPNILGISSLSNPQIWRGGFPLLVRPSWPQIIQISGSFNLFNHQQSSGSLKFAMEAMVQT